MKHRAMIVPRASGDVLEIGAGGGMNADYYDPLIVSSLVGIDPSQPLVNRARSEWSKKAIEIDLRLGVAECLPFDAGRFDTVLTTFTLCSVSDQSKALAEAKRVLKPSGRLLFLEHGLAPDASIRKWQRRIEPVWKKIAGGCHLARSVTRAIEQADFIVDADSKYLPKTPRFLGWIEWGSAQPA